MFSFFLCVKDSRGNKPTTILSLWVSLVQKKNKSLVLSFFLITFVLFSSFPFQQTASLSLSPLPFVSLLRLLADKNSERGSEERERERGREAKEVAGAHSLYENNNNHTKRKGVRGRDEGEHSHSFLLLLIQTKKNAQTKEEKENKKNIKYETKN